MAVGVRLKKSIKTKSTGSFGRNRETGDRKKSRNRGTVNVDDSYGESYDFKPRRENLDLERGERRNMRPGYPRSTGNGIKFDRMGGATRKRRDFDADDSEERIRSRGGVRELRGDRRDVKMSRGRRSDFDGDHSGTERIGRREGVRELRGQRGDVKVSRGRRRDFDEDDYDTERIGRRGGVRELRGHRGDVKVSRGRRRDFDEDDSDTERIGRRGGEHELRGHRGDVKVSRGRRRDFNEGDSDTERIGRRGGMRELRGHRGDFKVSRGRRDFDEDVSDTERIDRRGGMRELRGHRGDFKPPRGKRRDFEEDDSDTDRVGRRRRSEVKSVNFEGSADKLRSRGKRMDENKGDAVDELSEKNAKSEEKTIQIDEKKPIRRQTRVLDKTGKKIRVQHKSADGDSDVPVATPKKRKRVIRIDPHDISNKRLVDSIPDPNSEKTAEEEAEMSKNAQFRAIQPSPSILSFVEDNLLGRRRLNDLRNAGYNIKLSAPLDNIPFSTSLERERIEENVFKNKLEFFAAAKISSSFPPPMIPEIAFAGRSNVGKSSLLNALTRQWGVVRTSDKPGHTQSINFFSLASKLCLVDLPGYGFAYAKEEVKDAWEELVKEYVSTRVGLQNVCLLIDTKWGMKPRDYELIDLMERSQTPYQIVLTKTDVVFPIDVARRAMQIQENMKTNKSIINPVMMVSSKSGAGIRCLRTALAKIARFVKP